MRIFLSPFRSSLLGLSPQKAQSTNLLIRCLANITYVGTLDGSYQEPWGATGTRLRPMEAIILGHFLATKSPQTKPV